MADKHSRPVNPEDSIYGNHYDNLVIIKNYFEDALEDLRKTIKEEKGYDPIEHLKGRIKTEESMREKCRRNGLPETTEAALGDIHDAIGIRVVCPFIDDVYLVKEHIETLRNVRVFEEKDYIKNVKPNGYRSYHLILKYEDSYFVEIQLRTISMDTWAALEHSLKYKKNLGDRQALIVDELKRCADELASTDLSMQAIRNMIMAE